MILGADRRDRRPHRLGPGRVGDRRRRLTASELFIYPLPLIATLATVTGILMFTAEAQHGTLAVALTARPARWVIVAAKTTMATTVGLALGATGMVAGFGGAVLGGVELGRRIGAGPPGAVGPALHRPRRGDRAGRRA